MTRAAWSVIAVVALALGCAVDVAAQSQMPGGGSAVQAPGASLVDEIVRKAESREAENGFCAGTGWPLGDDFATFKAWLEGANVGTWKANRYASGACELNRVTRIHNDAATGRCVTYSRWNCRKGQLCLTGSAVDCLDRNGKLTTSD